jgi:hypothetical protein
MTFRPKIAGFRFAGAMAAQLFHLRQMCGT